MKIQKKVNTREVSFSSLVGGDTFHTVEDPDVFWMKTDYIELDEDDGFNAVDLFDGTMAYFVNSEKIIPVTIKATVEG